jgi:hypothetical protein
MHGIHIKIMNELITLVQQSVTNAKCIIFKTITPFFNAYCVAVHNNSDLICEERFQLELKLRIDHILNFIITGNLCPCETCFGGPNV